MSIIQVVGISELRSKAQNQNKQPNELVQRLSGY